jgi:hypothetical protein
MLIAFAFIVGVAVGVVSTLVVRARHARQNPDKVAWQRTRPPVVLVAPGTDPEAPVQAETQGDAPVILDAFYVRPNLPGSNSKME